MNSMLSNVQGDIKLHIHVHAVLWQIYKPAKWSQATIFIKYT